MIGKTLAHYQIIALIGKGGMGEVYRARDTKLDRDVAIKVLSTEMSDDTERIARFRREAKTLATLQHENIASIYGFEDSPQARFLVMEAVDGEDLSQRLQRGRIPVEDALELARQIAVGLEAAHDHGIVHRDLKPANVMVTPEGQVKILDFGLARGHQGDGGSDLDISNSPTVTAAVTGAGTLLGTAGYMSPEQARGHIVDQRTDIWAFGVILFEMLSGKRLFEGDTVSDKLASILKVEPQWELLPSSTPPRIRELLERCLAKRRRDRLKDIGDVRLEIEWIQQGKAAVVSPPSSSTKRIPLIPALIGAVLLATLVGVGIWNLRSAGGGAPGGSNATAQHRVTIEFPPNLTVVAWLAAPDGTVLLWARPQSSDTANSPVQLYLRAPDRYEVRPVAGSTGVEMACFSQDSKWLAWLAPDQASGSGLYLMKAPVDGSSPPLRVLSWRDDWERNLHWLRDGDIVTATYNGEFLRIPADGSEPRPPVPINKVGFKDEFVPASAANRELPDGIHIFDDIEVWTEEGYSRRIAVANLDTGEAHVVLDNASYPNWVDSGHLLFSRGSTILAVRFDPISLTTQGQPFAVADGLRAEGAWNHGEFGVSRHGDLYHEPGGIVGQQRQLQWSDRTFQTVEPWSPEKRAFENTLRISPDGQHLAIVIASPTGLFEVWISETSRPALRRFLFETGRDCHPMLWLPDNSGLVYGSFVPGNLRIMLATLDGRKPPRLLFEDSDSRYDVTSLADDGRILLVERRSQGQHDVLLYRMEDDSTDPPQERLLAKAGEAQVSTDGQWVAYESDSSGQMQVYARRWLGDGQLGREIPVSLNGGIGPFWYQESANAPLEIWYRSDDGINAVVIENATTETLGQPRLITKRDARFVEGVPAPDGRFLMLTRGEDEKDPVGLNVILNWRSELDERLRVAR